MKKLITICIKKNEKNRRIRMWKAFCPIVVLAFLSAGYAAQATTFDVAADFSATDNPNGVWSYGWSSTLTSALNLYPDNGKMGEVVGDPIAIDVWFDWEQFSSYSPNVAHNPTGSINNDHWTITWQPWQFSLHPGDGGEYSHARWTAPDAGTIDIASMFTGIDHYFGTTTDVHVLHNGISLFDGLVNGFGNTSSFSTTVSVGKGDIIDFAVGYGSNQTHTCDTTALSVTIVSEPAIEVLVDINPDSLNKNSKGQWVTVYITLPEGYDVNKIDPNTIAITSLTGASCLPDYHQDIDLSFAPQIGDRDEDGIADLTVKFSRQELIANLCLDDVAVTVEGQLFSGKRFKGIDHIRVIDRGK